MGPINREAVRRVEINYDPPRFGGKWSALVELHDGRHSAALGHDPNDACEAAMALMSPTPSPRTATDPTTGGET